jgi:hypothetical protein
MPKRLRRSRTIRSSALIVSVLWAWFAAGAANAAWYKAETDRFVVYGEGREQSVRDYALKLTTYDHVLRLFHPSTLGRVPDTKLIVYLVNSRSDLKRIRPALPSDTAGFYTAMNEGIFAVATTEAGFGADDVMFHEYAHHFMLENFPAAYPAWFVEGFAEYFMTAEVLPGSVKIGAYNPARAYSLARDTWIPLGELLSRTTAETRKERIGAYYSQAWLLTHYMRSAPERRRQLDVAINAIASGVAPVKAMEDATGMSLAELTKLLKAYKKLELMTFMDPMKGVTPAITVTVMDKSTDDLLLDNLRLILAPTGRIDAPFLAAVRRKAAKYPGDALAEITLARAEFVMGDVAAGEALVKRRLEAQPQDGEALLLAGTGQLMAGIRDPAKREERYRAARPLLVKAYGLNKKDFRPLYGYALSRTVEPAYPTVNDLNAWIEARLLAPAVAEISFHAGTVMLTRGDRPAALRVLTPLMNNPHGGNVAAQVRALIEGQGTEVADADKGTSGTIAKPATNVPGPTGSPQ